MLLTPANEPTSSHPDDANAAPQNEFDSRELMRGARAVVIHHAGQVYRLLHTRNDKLILVK